MVEQKETTELIIREGLSAVYLPETEKDAYGDPRLQTPEVVLANMNNFLERINQQGGDIVGIIDVEVDGGSRPGSVGVNRQMKKVVIIRKGYRDSELVES